MYKTFMYEKHVTGSTGERLAAKYLVEQGYTIIETNFATRWAEIDIIAKKAETIYFFEVKTRRTLKYGHPYAAVSPRKIYKIQQTGLLYVKRHNLTYRALAVGVVGILMNAAQRQTTIEHVII